MGHKAATFDKATNRLHDACSNDGFDRAVRFVMQVKRRWTALGSTGLLFLGLDEQLQMQTQPT